MNRNDLAEFDRIRDRSPFCRLLLGASDLLSRNFNGSEELSLAFVAFVHGNLKKLDDLLIKYQIETRATTDFKKRLNDLWLNEDDDKKRRDKMQRVLAALTEIIAPNFLSKTETIIKLCPIDTDCKGDFESICKDRSWVTEIKFIGQLPQLADQMIDAARNNGVAAGFIEGPEQLYNYVVFRIAQAVSQFERIGIPIEQRRVFIIFYKSGQLFEDRAIQYLRKKQDWIHPDDWKATFLALNSKGEVDLQQSVQSYLEKVGQILCANLIDYEIRDFEIVL